MRLTWLTDTHLNFIRHPEAWWAETVAEGHDAFLFTGDITTGSQVPWTIEMLADAQRPVYFVLGNHDYYGFSIEKLRRRLAGLPAEPAGRWAKWLGNEGVVRLTESSALIGDDGWYDGRNGEYMRTDVQLNDFYQIPEFKGHKKGALLKVIQRYADASAARVRDLCLQAASDPAVRHVYVATHVPPFANAAWHMGQPSDPFFQPFFSSRVMGEAIVDATAEFRVRGGRVTVLCGHSHSEGTIYPASGMEVHTGKAEYGRPEVYRVLDVE